MRTITIILIVLVGLLTNCHSKKTETNDKTDLNMELSAKNNFERIDDKNASGTSLIKHRESTNVEAPIGDFLSRIWNLYEKPNGVSNEGFQYTFKDVKTGLVFTAYSAGSGPAYGGDSNIEDKLLPIIIKFDKMLTESKNADCEISIQTDFGTLVTGSKNGVPFDKLIEE